MFQSERRLSKELSRILVAPQEKMELVERRALEDEQDFLVSLPSDWEIQEGSFIRLREGAELVLAV